MQNRVQLMLWILIISFGIGLLSISIFSDQLHCENLLLATPTLSNTSKISSKALEKLTQEAFLSSYEIRSAETLKILNRSYPVALIKTNYAYPLLSGKNISSGSFFSEQDQKKQKKMAVLNKTAAYAMFGNDNIRGLHIDLSEETYTIEGVLDDKNKAENIIYVPAVSDQSPNAFIVHMEERFKKSEIENKCIALGLERSDYHFLESNPLLTLIHGSFYVGLSWIIIALFLLRLRQKRMCLRENIELIKSLSKQFYVVTWLRSHPKTVLKLFFHLGEILLIIAVILKLIPSSITFFLVWHNTPELPVLSDISAFTQVYLQMKNLFFISQTLLIGLFISISLLLMGTFYKRASAPTTKLRFK
ncbi:ABC transporter permease [Fusibacter ferrireducens]|uniref:ABC transporter permease n=1 Tax=Fusibacter ferrireducens TaxID=2785058 RepID=A0ABR9ZN59_9FIRM|nr:ABC transporter permease [Fusibacter ferrireducens]MBF4691903.1 ABC transporter permease [Fusibacter ferrireducens]